MGADDSEEYDDRIVFVEESDTTFTVEINISANCCNDFICDASNEDNGVLNLIYYNYGNYCFCECCFGLRYEFSKTDFPDNPEKIKGIMINGDARTLKYLE